MMIKQARTQTFEQGGAYFKGFYKGLQILRKFWIWGQN